MKKNLFYILQYIIIGVTSILCLVTYVLMLLTGRGEWYEIKKLISTLFLCVICQLFVPHAFVIITAAKACRGEWDTAKILMIFALLSGIVMLPVSFVLSYIMWMESPARPMFWIVYIPLAVMAAGEIAINLIYFKKR